MNKEFVPYEIAVALKELGFNEPCFGCYTEKKEVIIRVGDYRSFLNNNSEDTIVRDFNSYENGTISLPLYQQAFRWFREEHGYYCEPFVDDDKTFGFLISSFVEMGRLDQPLQRNYLTPEEAELECIKKLIELCKKN